MESLAGITVGINDRYLLRTLVSAGPHSWVYDALDRTDDSAKLLEIWDREIPDQDEFLQTLHNLANVEDRRLLPILDGGILVVPIGAEILREVPYIVTTALEGGGLENLTLEQVLTLGIKVTSILSRLHNGTHIRSRSGQIIGQLKLSHGNLSRDSVWLDPDRGKVILKDWYRNCLLEGDFLPQRDIEHLLALLRDLIPHPTRSVRQVLEGEYSNAQSLGADLRRCQIKMKPRGLNFYTWSALVGCLALSIGLILHFVKQRQPQLESVAPVTPPTPIEVIPPRRVIKFVPKPEAPREQQVYRIDLPLPPVAPKPKPPLPIPRSVRPTPPVTVRPTLPLPPVPNPTLAIKPPPVAPLVPPSKDSEPANRIETTIDANFAPSYKALVQQAGKRALVTIAGEFINPNRQAVSMIVFATKQGRTAPIFSASVTREQWEKDPTGTTWANFMSRSDSLLGFSGSSPSPANTIRINPPLVPSIQPLPPTTEKPQPSPKKNPTQEEIEEEIQNRK